MAITRRNFLKGSLASAAVISLPPTAHALGSNNDIRLAVIGTGGQGTGHVKRALGAKGVRVVAVCDADITHMARAAKYVEGAKKGKVKQYQDIRKLMDDKEIDAIITATPNHWHTLVGIWACQAGKDIYIEKPICHNIFEGRKLVEAAEKYKRIVQHGTQTRSDSYIGNLKKFLATGKIGKITCVRGLCYKPRGSIGNTTTPTKIPDHIDYDLWCGPAPMVPLMRKRLHYDWHWIWDTGCGDMGNQGIHEMDQARWMLGDPVGPPRAISIGGRLGYKDDGQTANTQMVYFDYKPAPLIFETRGLPESKKDRRMSNLKGCRIGIVVECEGGYFAGKHGGTVFDNDGKKITQIKGGGAGNHPANFYKAIRSRKASDIPSDALSGLLSCTLVHLGNISHRLGATMPDGEIREKIKGNKLATETYGRMADHLAKNEVDIKKATVTMGPWLEFDAKAERFTNSDKANKMLTRNYREPYVVPQKV